jgi:hypothetical protein
MTNPSGIAAGDLLVAMLYINGGNGAAGVYSSNNGGYSYIGGDIYPSGNSHLAAILAKIADGSEGGTFNVTATNNSNISAVVCRITGAHPSAMPERAAASATSGASDPPNLTVSWGAANNLFIAWAGPFVITGSPPAGYTAIDSHASHMCASNGVQSASENPGTYGTAPVTGWVATTIGIRPPA